MKHYLVKHEHYLLGEMEIPAESTPHRAWAASVKAAAGLFCERMRKDETLFPCIVTDPAGVRWRVVVCVENIPQIIPQEPVKVTE